MATALQLIAAPVAVPSVPWRDPQTISREELQTTILSLERACEQDPGSVDLRTCLGMAYAMNFDVYGSMEALETAVRLDPQHFWARLKYAELHYRIRALARAEEEMLVALSLARSSGEVAIARKHLAEIRRLWREGTQKPVWTKSLTAPVCVLVFMLLLSILVVVAR